MRQFHKFGILYRNYVHSVSSHIYGQLTLNIVSLTREEEVDAVPKVVEVCLVQPLLEPPVDPQPQQDPKGADAKDLQHGERRASHDNAVCTVERRVSYHETDIDPVERRLVPVVQLGRGLLRLCRRPRFRHIVVLPSCVYFNGQSITFPTHPSPKSGMRD